MIINELCSYSGLPYTCNYCSESNAPCDYMNNIRSLSRIFFLNLRRVWVCKDSDIFILPRVFDYGVKKNENR